jgi:hypothetical protein
MFSLAARAGCRDCPLWGPASRRVVLLQTVQILEEQKPRRLLGLIQFRTASAFFPKDVVDVFEGLLEHENIGKSVGYQRS